MSGLTPAGEMALLCVLLTTLDTAFERLVVQHNPSDEEMRVGMDELESLGLLKSFADDKTGYTVAIPASAAFARAFEVYAEDFLMQAGAKQVLQSLGVDA